MSQQKFGIGSVPATPESGYVTIYPKANKRMYGKDDAGNEFSLGAIADTDALPEGSTNLYFTNERAQDAVGGALSDSSDIDFTYNDAGNSITADLTATGVIADSYGDGFNIPQITVDAKGRVTSVTEVAVASLASTDALPEGTSNLYFTNERAQDAVGNSLSDSSNIDFTYNDAGNSITADLTDTGVSAATYGTSTAVPQITVDSKGRLTSVSNVSIALPSNTDSVPEGSSNLYFTNERAQDAVGNILGDSSSVDFVYNDAGNSITATVLPDGIGTFSTITERYGFPTSSDTLVQILSELAYTQSLQKRVISTNAVIPDGHVWLRGETRITGTANIRLLGDSNMRFI